MSDLAHSTRLDPSFSIQDEEDGVPASLKPVVFGPPGFASPDPQTQAAKLDGVENHINQSDISDDYASEVDSASAPESTSTTDARNDGEPTGGYESLTKTDLQDIARERGIEGFSSMKKDELVAALEVDDDENSADDNEDDDDEDDNA